MKQAQLDERKSSDPALQAQIDALVAKVNAYQGSASEPEAAPSRSMV